MSQSAEITVVPTLAPGAAEEQGENVLAFDFVFGALAKDEEGPAVQETADISGFVDLGGDTQFMKVNKTHRVVANYTVRVDSKDETIPESTMACTLNLPGIFSSGKTHTLKTAPVKKKTVSVFSTSITVTGVKPTKTGEFELRGTATYRGKLIEGKAKIVVTE
jgi:hypothetical protein